MVDTQNLSFNPNKVDPILWVGDVSPIRVPHFFPFQKQEIEIILKASVTEAFEVLNEKKFSIIIVHKEAGDSHLEFLNQARLFQPSAPRLLIAEELSEREVRDGINQAQVFQFVRWPVSDKDLWQHLQRALQKQAQFMSRIGLLRESSNQNKQLEALTNSLEEIVEDRTAFIQLSHQEEAEKLNRERQLIRFIKDLSTQTGFEEILGLLRKDLRKFHKMGDPILVYRIGGSKTFFLSYQQGVFTRTESTVFQELPKAPQMSSPELKQYFANHFGRPFIRAYLVPLEIRPHLQFGGGANSAEAVLCFENALNDSELPVFVDFIMDRMRPLSMAVDRVFLERQLRSFSDRWEKTFNGMRDPIAILDLDFEVVLASRKFSDNIERKKCYQSFANRESPCEGCPVGLAIKEGRPHSGQIRRGDKIFQVHSYPILSRQGSMATNIVNQYVDITQSRELYLQLLQSEKMGAIGMLAGNIAHELNNPLTGIRSLAQVLLTEVDEAGSMHADLIEIEKATGRSQRIIKNLLEFSQGEQQAAEQTSVDDVVEKTLPMLKAPMRMHRQDVRLGSSGVQVMVEPYLLQQVLYNLINNACQAMKEPGALRIETFSKEGQVFIEIADSGPGIPQGLEKKIFEPFFTTKKEGHGTGLGLSMSKSIIEKFGGTISFRNIAPNGSCFTIVLPQHGQR